MIHFLFGSSHYTNSTHNVPALSCAESPDSRLKSSRAEAAEVGAEETEEVALLPTGGADEHEISEQPKRESSAVRVSEESPDTRVTTGKVL